MAEAVCADTTYAPFARPSEDDWHNNTNTAYGAWARCVYRDYVVRCQQDLCGWRIAVTQRRPKDGGTPPQCGHISDLWPPLPTDPLGRAEAICEAVDAAFLAAQTLAGPVEAIRRLDTAELPGLAQGTERAAFSAIWIALEEAHHVAHELKNALNSATCR